MQNRRPPRPRQRGFTYLGVLLMVVLGGTALAAAGSLWRIEAKRDKEAQLLFAGEQIRSAIEAYWAKTPTGQPQTFPKSFEDLLNDKRWPTRRRHLRQVFFDPMLNSREWGLVEAPNGGLMGVFSRSDDLPLKRGLFAPAQADFADAKTYRDWRFVYGPGGRAKQASAAASR